MLTLAKCACLPLELTTDWAARQFCSHLLGLASTKTAHRRRTYAQKVCSGHARSPLRWASRYQTHSDPKSLIYIALIICFFLWHFNESLDFKGPKRWQVNLSTKLSTEMLKNFKASMNQALSAVFACDLGELPRKTGRLKVPA